VHLNGDRSSGRSHRPVYASDCDLGWTERMKRSSAVIVTASGKHGFRETFGIGMPEETERR